MELDKATGVKTLTANSQMKVCLLTNYMYCKNKTLQPSFMPKYGNFTIIGTNKTHQIEILPKPVASQLKRHVTSILYKERVHMQTCHQLPNPLRYFAMKGDTFSKGPTNTWDSIVRRLLLPPSVSLMPSIKGTCRDPMITPDVYGGHAFLSKIGRSGFRICGIADTTFCKQLPVTHTIIEDLCRYRYYEKHNHCKR